MMKMLEVEADFDFEVVEKTSKDFVPILLKYKTRVKPEMLVVAVTQPGGFLLLKQAHEINFAPSASTMVLDGTCTAQNAEVFWAALKEAGQYVMMACPIQLQRTGDRAWGKSIKKRYIEQFKREPNYLPLQGYDAMFTLLTAIEAAGSTDAKAIIAAWIKTKLTGTRGDITFAKEKGVWHNQWKEVPAFIFQYTEVDQSPADAAILYPPKFANAGIAKPEK